MEIHLITFLKNKFNLKNATKWMLINKFPITDYPTITEDLIIFKILDIKFNSKLSKTRKLKGEGIFITFSKIPNKKIPVEL